MNNKRIPIGNRPLADPTVETWVRKSDGPVNLPLPRLAPLYAARLTIDVTATMRGRIKVAAFRQGVTVADLLRGLLEREFPHREGDL